MLLHQENVPVHKSVVSMAVVLDCDFQLSPSYPDLSAIVTRLMQEYFLDEAAHLSSVFRPLFYLVFAIAITLSAYESNTFINQVY